MTVSPGLNLWCSSAPPSSSPPPPPPRLSLPMMLATTPLAVMAPPSRAPAPTSTTRPRTAWPGATGKWSCPLRSPRAAMLSFCERKQTSTWSVTVPRAGGRYSTSTSESGARDEGKTALRKWAGAGWTGWCWCSLSEGKVAMVVVVVVVGEDEAVASEGKEEESRRRLGSAPRGAATPSCSSRLEPLGLGRERRSTSVRVGCALQDRPSTERRGEREREAAARSSSSSSTRLDDARLRPSSWLDVTTMQCTR